MVGLIVNLDPGVEMMLAENGVDLGDLVEREGLRAELRPTPVRADTKDALVIVAVGASVAIIVAAVARAVATVADAVGRNRVVTTSTQQLVPVVEPDGSVVTDASGNPVLYWKDETDVHATSRSEPRSESTVAEILGAVRVSIETTVDQ